MRKCNKVLLGCIILFLGLNAVSVKGDVKGHRTTWDCIWFGTYPQTEIPNVSQLTNKKYLYNAKERQYGYTAKNKEGEKVTVGMIDYTTEKHILLKNSFKSTGGDRNFKFKPIKWRILKTNGNKALLLSDKIIDQYYMYKPSFVDALIFYTGLQTDFIWRNSSLRNYMNSDMYEMAFSVYEQDAILDSRVTTGFTYKDEKDVTTDKLFILSHDELVKNYGFSSQESLMCRISDFARASGVDIYDSYGKYGTYYALSDGYKSTHFRYGDEYEYACCEAYNDVIDNTGLLKRKNALYYNGIRVAMWVDLSKCEYQNAGTVSSNGDVNEIKFKYPIKL